MNPYREAPSKPERIIPSLSFIYGIRCQGCRDKLFEHLLLAHSEEAIESDPTLPEWARDECIAHRRWASLSWWKRAWLKFRGAGPSYGEYRCQ